MLVAEYDYDTDIAIQRKESLMLGIQQGRSEGLQQGRSEGLQQGRSEGLQQGLAEGKALGFAEGKRETAKLMKQSACDTDFIIKITGLTQAEIEAL